VSYSTTEPTNQDVVATVALSDGTVTSEGGDTHVFTENGGWTFEFTDDVGNTGSIVAEVTWIDKTSPTAEVSYSTTEPTNQDVVATVALSDGTVTSEGGDTHVFTENGSWTFEFTDDVGNTGSIVAEVTWIDKAPPKPIGAGFELYLESYEPATFPKVSTEIDEAVIDDQLEISRLAAQLAFSSEGWGWGDYSGSLIILNQPPKWSAEIYVINIPDPDQTQSELFGYELNAEALAYGPSRQMWFHTDTLAQRSGHDNCESADNFGTISGGLGGFYAQCAVPEWGRFYIVE
jgi:hypothetical protein